MALAKTNVEINSFVRGLITEANALTFPEDASLAEDNMLLNRDGSRRRRLGMDYEAGYSSESTQLSGSMANSAVATYEWLSVGGNANISIGVVQVGPRLWFMDLNTSAPSANLLNSGNPLTLTEATVGGVVQQNHPIQWTEINGMLIGAGEALPFPILLEYDEATDVVSLGIIYVAVRDIWGVAEEVGVNYRPPQLSDAHHYNLLNQGWPSNLTVPAESVRYNTSPRQQALIPTDTTSSANPHIDFKNDTGSYPSNADKWYVGKRDSDDEFDSDTLIKNTDGTTPAPRGKFVIDLLSRGQSRMDSSGVSGLPSDTETGRLTSVATYSGRVFYSGIQSSITGSDKNSPNYTGTVFYTQVADTKDKLYRCYQVADPTSENDPDLAPNDGGSIPIPGASKIIKMVSMEAGLIVFANNGVWQITGPEGIFSATEYTVKFVSSVGCLSADSIVRVDSSVFYWTRSGIYTLNPEQVTGRLVANNISVPTIQTLYLGINVVGKENSRGVYDPVAREIKWLYNDTDAYDGVVLRHNYNRELVLDLHLQAFSTNTVSAIDNQCPYLAGYIVSPDYINTTYQFDVYSGDSNVTTNAGADQVVFNQEVRSRGESQLRYLVIIPPYTPVDEESETPTTTVYSFTLGAYADPQFRDWRSYDGLGIDAGAYVETGNFLHQDTIREKQIPEIVVHCARTEDGFELDAYQNLVLSNQSSCLMTVKWDFSDSVESGKETQQSQVYRFNRPYLPTGTGDSFNYGRSVVSTHNQIRGSGMAYRLRFETEPYKDMHLLGWGMVITGQTDE